MKMFNDELIRLVFDGQYETVHRDIREVLFDPIFDSRTNLTLNEAGLVSYERSRVVHARLESPTELLENPQRLFALAEWPALVDIACFSLLMVHYNLCFGTLFEQGRGREDLEEYRQALNSLECFGPYMATELGYGNDVAMLQTEAVYEHSTRTFLLNTPDPSAQKYMSYSGFKHMPKIAVVMARLKVNGTECGVFPFLVRLSTKDGLCRGIRTAQCPEKPAQGLDNGLTWFDNVRIPRANILLGDVAEITSDGEFKARVGNIRARFLRAMTRIVPGRLCVSSAAAALGRAAVYTALRYSQQRTTSAPGGGAVPVIEYRNHQLPVFVALSKVYAITLFVNRVKREYVHEGRELSSGTLALINITKAISTWEMQEVTTTCRERCGAQGIFSVNRIADYGLLLPGLVTAEGDNLVLMSTTVGQLFAQPWKEPLPEPVSDELCDSMAPAWVKQLLLFREHKLWTLGREIKASTQDQGYLESSNSTANLGIEMVRTRGMRIALESMLEAPESVHGIDVRTALELLCRIFALSELRRESGWYLAHGLMKGVQVLKLDSVLEELCHAVRPHISTLLDGFALTPELLRAPIASDDYISAFCKISAVTSSD